MKRSTHYYIYIIRLGCLLLLLWPQALRAQNNLYAIDDECYAYMAKINFKQDENTYLKLSDDMYNLAVKKNDKKAQVLSVSSVLSYYHAKENLERLRVYARKLRQIAQKNGYLQYYFFAYDMEVEKLVDADMDEAMMVAKEMAREAEKSKSLYGKFASYQQLGRVYKARHNISLSAKYYNLALDMAPLLETRQRTASIYISLAQLQENFTYKMKALDQALNVAMDATDLFQIYTERCITLGKFDHKEEFMNAYKKMEEQKGLVEFGTDENSAVQAYKAAFDGNYDAAYKYIDSDPSYEKNEELWDAGVNIAIRQGNGMKALAYARQAEQYKEWVFVNNRGYEFAELADLVENEELQARQSQQAASRRKIDLANQTLLMEQKELEENRITLSVREQEVERRNQESVRQAMTYEDSLRDTKVATEVKRTEELNNKQEGLNRKYFAILIVLAITIALFGLMMLFYRITSRRLLNKAKVLRQAKMEALDAAGMKNVFIQNMSHEIRTPLNAVMGFSQLMTIPGLPLSDDEKVEYAQHILNNSKMLTMLVDDILNIAEIEKGNYSITPAVCSANLIMADAVSTAEYRAQSGVRVFYTSDVDDDYMIVADARRVQQVLINFLTNACKHTEKGTIHLHLSITDTPGMLTYSVTDQGCGIPKEQAENIFERFTKLNDFKQGTGLGLNICRLISTKMGGRVFCDTRYTNGARFVFEVPLKQPDGTK